jgi:hypothetical protein
MKIFAENFRGFRAIEIDLEKVTFLIGDNSSGKSSILHLVDSVLNSGLSRPPKLNEDLGVSEYDYFSPYFDYSDVTFGYSEGSGEDYFSKIITVRNRKNRVPEILICSYVVEGKMISIARSGAKGKSRVLRNIFSSDFSDLIDIHKKNSGYTIKSAPPKGVSLGDAAMLFSMASPKDIEVDSVISKIFGEDPLAARLVSPIRALPEKFYTFSRKLSSQGLHFATMWHDFSKLEKGRIFAGVEKFGKESKLFDRIRVRRISYKIDNSPLVVSVVKGNREFLLNQVGVGISQVVPILVETVFALKNKPKLKVLFQQPELHLHPIAQAALGSFIFRGAKDGLRGVIETHSSFLIDRFRAEIRDCLTQESKEVHGNPINQDVLILFCENTEFGNCAYEVKIDNLGRLSGEPDSYHQFFVDELTRTIF